MAAITSIYLIIAFINLGSSNIPVTSWKPAQPDEYLTVDFGRTVEVSKVLAYSGGGLIDYNLEYQDKNGTFIPLPNNKNLNIREYRHFYNVIDLINNNTIVSNRLKIVSGKFGGMLKEITIYEKGNQTPLSVTIADQKTDANDSGTLTNLFDEQSKMSYYPTYFSRTAYDEVIHVRTANELLNRLEPFEDTHPYLGHIFIALGLSVWGINPFGWRIIGTLFGAAMIPLMYIFGGKLFGDRLYAFCAAFLMAFDFMHFTISRVGIIDVYPTIFIMLMFYFMFDYYLNKSYRVGFKQSLKPLFFCGLFFGAGVACKWYTLYGAPALALLFFMAKYGEYQDYRNFNRRKSVEHQFLIKDSIPHYLTKTILYWILFFVVIPVIIYLSSYIPFSMVAESGHGLKDILVRQVSMFQIQNQPFFKETSAQGFAPFTSSWWSWPMILVPQRFTSATGLPAEQTSIIYSMGNPAIWWAGIIAVIAGIVIAIKKKDQPMMLVLGVIACLYLPWSLVVRQTFISHFFSVTPFLILAIVSVIKHLIDSFPKLRPGVYIYLGIVALLFIMFYPILSGLIVDKSYIHQYLMWFKDYWNFTN
jgi:dolichyl-phosphate-mannose-protein mannosyltransferase